MEELSKPIKRDYEQGMYYQCHQIYGSPFVVKRLKTGIDITRNVGGRVISSPEEIFQLLQEEHALCELYFGDMVPKTTFLKLDEPLMFGGDVDPDLELVALQEECKGCSMYMFRNMRGRLDAEFKGIVDGSIREFIRRYTDMKEHAQAVPELQIMIDPETGVIKLYDTNHLARWDSVYSDAWLNSITDASQLTPDSLLELLASQSFSFTKDPEELQETLLTLDGYNRFLDHISDSTDEDTADEVSHAASIPSRFPAFGRDNESVRELKQTFLEEVWV